MATSHQEQADQTARLTHLRTEHSDLDSAIKALEDGGLSNELQIKRLKKRKLQLKDQIVKIEDTMMPDIIA